MQYLGGKSRLGVRIASAIGAAGLTHGWEPFCGGCGASTALAALGPLVCSDIHPALIAMWQAVQQGWTPPEALSEDEYAAARDLPDSDPLKAFAAFGCSFGGKEFGGFARSTGRDHTEESRRRLRKDADLLRATQFVRMSFFDPTPCSQAPGAYIYCDPPYADTTAYRTGAWDSVAFWARAREWAAFCPVYVSEFSGPDDACVVAEFVRKECVSRTKATVVDRLYRLG